MTTTPITRPERIPLAMPPGVPGGSSQAAALGPADILRAIRTRLFRILFVWIFCIGLTAGITAYLVKYHPKFQAAAQVLIESPMPEVPFQMFQMEVPPSIMNRYLLNQALLARSPQVIQAALQDVEVRATQWFRDQPQSEVVKELTDQIVVEPLKGTSYLTIMMSTKSPNDPHIIANAVTKAYLDQADKLSRTSLKQQLNDYEREQGLLANRLREMREKIDSFISTLDPGAASTGSTVMIETQQVTELLVNAEADKNRAKGLFDSYRAAEAEDFAISPQLQQLIETDPQVATLQSRLNQLQELEAFNLQELGPEHKQVKRLQSRIQRTDEDLNDLRTQKRRDLRDYLAEQAELEYVSALEQELSLRDRLLQLKERHRDIEQKLLQLNALREEKISIENKLARLQQFTDQVRLVTYGERTVQIRPIAQAERPLFRAFPNWFINMPIGTVLGLALAVGLAILRELMDTSVRAPADIVRAINIPLLGTVPDLDDEEIAIDDIETAVQTAPHSMIAEAFRSIRTNLFFSGPPERRRSLMITSPHPEDGKSSVAVNLAAAIAQSGKRVLLIEANLRRPVFNSFFGLHESHGLSNLLIGDVDLPDVIQKTNLPNLDVITSGPIPPNPAELLGSNYMRDALAQVIDQYDQVLLDTPPVLLVTDALALSSHVDGVILVIRANTNTKGVANRSRDLLNRVNAYIIGGILNAARVRSGGYFREQLRTFYDYQPEEEQTAISDQPSAKAGKKAKRLKSSSQDGETEKEERTLDPFLENKTDDPFSETDADLDSFFGGDEPRDEET